MPRLRPRAFSHQRGEFRRGSPLAVPERPQNPLSASGTAVALLPDVRDCGGQES